jgi:hypothetical protein
LYRNEYIIIRKIKKKNKYAVAKKIATYNNKNGDILGEI